MSKSQEKKEEGVKKYSLSDIEKQSFKRILSTMGFLNTCLEGLQYSLQVQQAAVEKRVSVGEAPKGFTIQTRIDMETFELLAKQVKIEEPKVAAPEEEKK